MTETPPETRPTTDETEPNELRFERQVPARAQSMSAELTTSTGHRLPDYDGACANLHGHNLHWEIKVNVEMAYAEDGMAVDLKDLKAVANRFDHALVLAADDPLVDVLGDETEIVHLPDGETPTCENMVWAVAHELLDLNGVRDSAVVLRETDKYSVSAHAFGGNRDEEPESEA